METPDLRQLKAFVAAARTQSFTKAAEHLFLTQSAVSHSLRSLEDQLDAKLLRREGRGVSLTPEGEYFLPRAEQILRDLAVASREVGRMREWELPRAQIGTSMSLCQHVLPSVLREFRESFPKCEIQISARDTPALIGLLERSEIDLAIGIDMEVPDHLEKRVLFTDELGFLMSPQHPWVEKAEIDASDLTSQMIVTYGGRSVTQRLFESYLTRLGLGLEKVLEISNMDAIKQMAIIDYGVGVVPQWIAQAELRSGLLAFRPISQSSPLQRTWVAYLHKERPLSLAHEILVGIFESVGQALALPDPEWVVSNPCHVPSAVPTKKKRARKTRRASRTTEGSKSS
ncbi:MAG: LysR family transcriptional regulator [Verrucomicrobiota bacterium]